MKTAAQIAIFLQLLLSNIFAQAQAPTANFRSDINKGCAPAVVNFTDLSFGNPTTWLWDFGNGNTSTRRNPATTYLTPGKYTVSLTVTNAGGETHTVRKETFVEIFDNPKPNFTAEVISGCSPLRMQFKDSSIADTSNRIVSWNWDMGDGTLATGPNPAHIYRNTGNNAITLKVTDDKGCSGIILKPKFVEIKEGVKAAFTNTAPSVCAAPANVSFTNQSTGPGTLSYTWLFGDGSTSKETNPTHTYTRNDTFLVKLVVASSEGCFDTVVQRSPIIIGEFKSDFRLKDSVCPGSTAQLVNLSQPAPASVKWIFSDGTTSTAASPSYVFTTGGSHKIRLINNYNGCIDTLEKEIQISEKPKIAFSISDSTRCAPDLTARFTTNTPGVRYYWEFGDSAFSTERNPTHIYKEYGSFSVKLIVTNAAGCIDTLVKPNLVQVRKPKITFNLNQGRGCIPYVYTPEVKIDSADAVVSYLWDFGDGKTSSSRNPSHSYTTVGNYDIKLTIRMASGCTETETFPNAVRVGTKPKADFTASPLNSCANIAIDFINNSTSADEYLWDFGDGTDSKVENPKHEFQDTGFLDIRLIAFNSGCADTLTRLQYVNISPPISAFGIIANCSNSTEYTFTDQSVGPESWLWDFGDGTKFTGKTPPKHFFPGEGTYNVSLTTTNKSCTHTTIKTIFIGNRPVDFIADTTVACKPAGILLSPTNTDVTGIGSLVWTFSDNNTNAQATSEKEGITYNFTKAGYYTVKMVTIDTFGCRRDSLTKVQYLRINGPTADFISPKRSDCISKTVLFEDRTTTDGENKIVKWDWNFGLNNDIETFTSGPFTKRYDSTGDFNVRVKVTDAAGCTDIVSKRAYINISTIKAQWTSSQQVCPDQPVQFTNQTQHPSFTSNWEFGDGKTANTTSPGHTFTDTGYFSVRLVVTSNIGCTDTLLRPKYVYSGRPKADFTANNLVSYCTPFEARFINKSTYYTASVWNLGQGTSSVQNPQAYYTQTGKYEIKLTVTSPGGCRDSVVKTLTIKNPAESVLRYVAETGCSPIKADFEAFDDMNGRFVWDFGNGNVVDTSVNKIAHIYRDFGSFIPSVILYEPSGCVLTLKGADTILAVGVKSKFGVNQNLFCDRGLLVIQDSTTANDPIVSYKWDFGDGTSSSELSPTHLYDKPGNYMVQLTTRTASGCFDTSAKVPVKISESPVINIMGDTAFCVKERRPYTGVLENLDSTTVKWQWVLPHGGQTTVQNPGMITFGASGDYQIRAVATNPDGCTDSVLKRIRVHPLPTVKVIPLQTILSGESVVLPAAYSSSVRQYLWSPNATLSCANCPQPTASPAFDTRYAINVVDSNGCRNSAETQVDVICVGANVFAPNTFSPNSDGKNDIFYLRGKGLDRVKLLRVFNRWGEVVFEKREFAVNDPAFGWDGTHKGKRPQPDVYVYQAEVYCSNGEIIRFDGNVALIQ